MDLKEIILAIEKMPLYEAPEHLSTMMQGYASAVAQKERDNIVKRLKDRL